MFTHKLHNVCSTSTHNLQTTKFMYIYTHMNSHTHSPLVLLVAKKSENQGK
jgi:hypothetical protein